MSEYLKTLERMEPDITAAVAGCPALTSIAVSLKRIADALERLAAPVAKPQSRATWMP